MAVFLRAIFFGILGGITGILPVNKNVHLLSVAELNKTIVGKSGFCVDTSVMLFVDLGILLCLFVLCFNDLKKLFNDEHKILLESVVRFQYTNELTCEEKINFLMPVFYICCFLGNAFNAFCDLTQKNILFSILFCVITAVLTFVCDYIHEKKTPIIKSMIGVGIGVTVCSFLKISILPIAVICIFLWGIHKKEAFGFVINVFFADMFFETVVLFVKAVISGFDFSWYLYAVCSIFSFVSSYLAVGFMKKAAAKRRMKSFGYYNLVVAVVLYYIFN